MAMKMFEKKSRVPIGLLVLFFLPSMAAADFDNIITKFHPYLDLTQEYTDNLDFTPTDRREDWITRLAPGIRFSTLPAQATVPGLIREAPTEPSGLELDYQLGFVLYAKNREDNYVSHDGRFDGWYTFDQRLMVRVRDYYTKSDEPRMRAFEGGAPSDRYLLGTQRSRAVYNRNIFEPSAGYLIDQESRIDVNYRNTIYQTRSSSYEDSQEDYLNPVLNYWFNTRNGIVLDGSFTNGNFEHSPDFKENRVRGRYVHRLNPRTSFFLEFIFEKWNFEDPGIDYEISNPSFGIEHAFSETVRGHIQAGYFWQNMQSRPSVTGLTYDVGLTKAAEQTTYSILFQAGYDQEYFTAENLGFFRYYRARGTVAHMPMERTTVEASGILEKTEYTMTGRADWTWRVGGNISYQTYRWLVLSMEYYHQENTSNIPAAQYLENRVILRLNAIY